jgi:putative ABC transporter-associated repeat protein
VTRLLIRPAALVRGLAAVTLAACAALPAAPAAAAAVNGSDSLMTAFAAAPADAATDRAVLDREHTDALSVRYSGGRLTLGARADLPGGRQDLDPAATIFHVRAQHAAVLVTSDMPAALRPVLGTPGSTVWMIPESQNPQLVWAGWETESIAAGALAGDTVDLTLLSAEGPGRVEVFASYDPFRDRVPRIFSSIDPAHRTLRQPVGAHVHANWAFSAQGRYSLTFRAAGTRPDGTQVTSEDVTYTFVVGDEVASRTTTALDVAPSGRSEAGEPVHLEAQVTASGAAWPDPSGTVEFFADDTLLGSRELTDGRGRLTTTSIPEGGSALWARFTPTDTADFTGSSSPETLHQVGAEASAVVTVSGHAASYRVGDRIALRAKVTPADAAGDVVWFRVASGSSTWTSAGSGATYTATATAGMDGARVRAELRRDGETVARAAAVTLDVRATPAPTPTPAPTRPSTPTPAPTLAPDRPGEPTETCRIEHVLDDGHVDLGVRTSGGSLRTLIKDGTAGPADVVWRDPATVALHIGDAARTPLPPGSQWAFLGGGASTWQIPQTQQAGVVWLGWNTEELAGGSVSGRVRLSLDAVDGPGPVAVYQLSPFGTPVVHFNSRDGLPDTMDVPTGVHAHAAWSFPAAGVYKLTFTYSGMVNGSRKSSTQIITVAVGAGSLDDLCPEGAPAPRPGNPGGDSGDEGPRGGISTPPVRTPASAGDVSGGTGSASGTGPDESCQPVKQDVTSTSEATVLADGHVDYAARIVDGRLESMVKDGTGTTPVWREPADVVLHVGSSSATQIAGSSFDFLGASGGTVWQISQTQQAGQPWLGWNTEEISAAQAGGPVRWTLTAADGPGDVVVYELGSFGTPNVLLNTGDGLPDAHEIPLGTHAHGNWAFTAEGTYRLTFEHSASLAGGAPVTDTETLTIVVGDDLPQDVVMRTSTTTETVGRTVTGVECSLAATGAGGLQQQVVLGAGLLALGMAFMVASAGGGLRRVDTVTRRT